MAAGQFCNDSQPLMQGAAAGASIACLISLLRRRQERPYRFVLCDCYFSGSTIMLPKEERGEVGRSLCPHLRRGTTVPSEAKIKRRGDPPTPPQTKRHRCSRWSFQILQDISERRWMPSLCKTAAKCPSPGTAETPRKSPHAWAESSKLQYKAISLSPLFISTDFFLRAYDKRKKLIIKPDHKIRPILEDSY